MSPTRSWCLTRRTILGAPLFLAARAVAAEPGLAADVETYVGFGEHRAGTKGEARTIRWLDQRLRNLGYSTERQRFPVRTLLDPDGSLVAAGHRTRLFPQWLPPANALNRTITAPLLALDMPTAPASIRLLMMPAKLTANWIEPLSDHVREAAEKGAVALLLALDDPSDDLFVCNQHQPEVFPIPVMLMARRDLPRLRSAIGAEVTLRVGGKLADSHAFNILGRKSGVGPTLVVSTPLTGWFHCGAERGPGIALWLRIAARLAQQSQPVLMLGTGSHEIGHLGMEYALAHGTPSPDAVGLWLHFGASLGATRLDGIYGYKSGQYLVGTETTAERAKNQLGDAMPFYVPGTGKTLGESGQVIGAGHRRFIGMSGQFPTFHTPLDKGEAIDFAQLEKIAAASETLFV